MNRILPILAVLCFLNQSAYGQTKEIKSKPVAEIFTDFHVNFNDTIQKTGFALNRAFLGYQFLPENSFSGKIVINIGTPEDLAPGSEPHRYAYCREASLTWSGKNLLITMGITGTKIFEFQQRFWGKRYLAKPFQSLNGYGFVADLGLVADYKINDVFRCDLTMMNGEGYSNIQLDNSIRTSLGITITPGNKLAFRLYGDIQKAEGLWQPVFVGFAGFRNDLITIGGEVSYKSNIDLVQGHHAWGMSATGGINLTEKTELFGRFDFVSSVIIRNDILKWNYLNDGDFIIAGIQYTFNQNVKFALNYQGRYPYAPGKLATDLLYINASFRF